MSATTGARATVLTAAALLAFAAAPSVRSQEAPGEIAYLKYCSQCHGETGDGKGPAARFLKPAPRDFTAGKYKIRHTPTGMLPTDEDLAHAIRVGLPYTAMPGFETLGEKTIADLVSYIKTFSADFEDPEALGEPISIPKPPSLTAEASARGREVYQETGCARCHGEEGRGDGMSAPTLTDDWGDHIRVADLTQAWTFRGGGTREDIFRTMSTGFNGTPMPGFHGALPVEDIWSITDYIVSLGGGATEAPYAKMVRALPSEDELDLDQGVELFADAPEAMFPLIGQIIEPGRSFSWPILAIRARAVYDERDIAILLQWNDMRAETSGTNGPDLVAPTWDEELAALGVDVGGSGEDDGGGFWGDAETEGGGDDLWGDAVVEEEESGDIWGDAVVEDEAGDDGGFWGDDVAAEDAGDDFWGTDEPAAAAGPSGPDTEFSDAVAIQFPTTRPVGVAKPYFLWGDAQNPVQLWYSDLATSEGSTWIARGSQTLTPGEGAAPEVVASYDKGQWTVIFKQRRSAVFQEDAFLPIAFSVWDGFHRERGNRRALTRWYDLYLEPMEAPDPQPPMIKAFFGVLFAEILLIGFVRRRKSHEAANPSASS